MAQCRIFRTDASTAQGCGSSLEAASESTTSGFSRRRTNAGVSSRFGRRIRKQQNEAHQEPPMCDGDLMRGTKIFASGQMELRTGAAASPLLAALPSFSNHMFFCAASGCAAAGGAKSWRFRRKATLIATGSGSSRRGDYLNSSDGS